MLVLTEPCTGGGDRKREGRQGKERREGRGFKAKELIVNVEILLISLSIDLYRE